MSPHYLCPEDVLKLTADRRMLHYQVAASITLLLLCLKDPTHAEARQDLESLNLLVRFVSKMVQSEGCDLKEVLQGCRGMAKLAASAIIRAEERASSGIQSEPPSNAGFLVSYCCVSPKSRRG